MTEPHLYREELTPAQFREAKLEFLSNSPTGCHTVLRALGEPIIAQHVDSRLWGRDPQWCSHDTPKRAGPDIQYMAIRPDHVLCQVCGAQYYLAELLNRLPEGKGQRKTAGKMDRTLAKINYNPQPVRYYSFRTGETASLSTDPGKALAQVHPSAKEEFAGLILEVADIARARQVIEDDTIEKPWATLRLRADMALDADWHNAPLSPTEQRQLKEQQAQTLAEKARDREDLISTMREEMNALRFKAL